MESFNSERTPKKRTLVAKETDIPGVFHIATPHNVKPSAENEAIIKAVIERINWKAIEAKN